MNTASRPEPDRTAPREAPSVVDAAQSARRTVQGFISSVKHNEQAHETSKSHVLEALRKHRTELTRAVEDSQSQMTLEDVRRRESEARITFDGFINDDDIVLLSIEDPIDPRDDRPRYSRRSAVEEYDSDPPSAPEDEEERDRSSTRDRQGVYSRTSKKGKAKITSSRLEENSEEEPEPDPWSRNGKEPESSSRKGKEPERYSSPQQPQPEIPQQSGGMLNWLTNANQQEIVDLLLDLRVQTNSFALEHQRSLLVEQMTASEDNVFAPTWSEEQLDYYRAAVDSLYTAIQTQSEDPNATSTSYETPYGRSPGGQSSKW